jgi:hypothetical protein
MNDNDTNLLQHLLRTAVDAGGAEAIAPGFMERLDRRLLEKTSPEEAAFGSLWLAFRPVAVAFSLLLVGLAIYNIHLSRQYLQQGNVAESVLGLPPVSAASVYDLDQSTPSGRSDERTN